MVDEYEGDPRRRIRLSGRRVCGTHEDVVAGAGCGPHLLRTCDCYEMLPVVTLWMKRRILYSAYLGSNYPQAHCGRDWQFHSQSFHYELTGYLTRMALTHEDSKQPPNTEVFIMYIQCIVHVPVCSPCTDRTRRRGGGDEIGLRWGMKKEKR